MIYWVYEVPNWMFAVLCVSAFIAFGIAGLLFARTWVRDLNGADHSHNHTVGYYLGAVTVLYGITLGLLAVGAWTNFSDVQGKVDHEAEAMSALYRDVSAFEDPQRTILQGDLQEYAWRVVCVIWPEQRKGRANTAASGIMDKLVVDLLSVNPRGPTQNIVETQAFSQFNTVLEARRGRLNSVNRGMPGSIWTLVVIGALISIAVTWFFYVPKLATHLWMTILFSGLLGLMIYMTAVMDNPFRGKLSVGPEPVAAVYHDTMKQPELDESTCSASPRARSLVLTSAH